MDTQSLSLVSMNEVIRRTSLSRTSIDKFRARGEFPKPVTLTEQRIAFVETEVNEWINRRIAGSRRKR